MLSLIIVYYHHRTDLDEFLKSLAKNSSQQFKLYIADLTGQLAIKQQFDFSWQIITGANRGYSYGVNLALQQALDDGQQQFVVLNYDMLLATDFIKRVAHRFQQADAFGGKIYYASGYEYHHERYSAKERGQVIWYAGGTINWQHCLTAHRGVDEVDRGQFDQLEPTQFITGACFAFNKQVVDKVGSWDEQFFLYYEDTDYSVRIAKAGFTLYYDPQIVLWHKNGGTTGGSGSVLQQKAQERSRLRFGIKHAPWRTKVHLLRNYGLRVMMEKLSFR